MEILNLYAGIGGNRKLWEGHNVTAVEYREDIADVYRHYAPNDTVIVGDAHQYLLDNYKRFDFIWSSPPCQTHSRARMWGFKNSDLFWCNFNIRRTEIKEADINRGNRKEWSELHGFDLTNHKLKSRKDQIYRNCVHPDTGLHILNCALGKFLIKKDYEQPSLFGDEMEHFR